MPAYKDKNGKWYVSVYYDGWNGQRDRKVKRGFSTKRDALEWERQFLNQSEGNLNMTFESFIELYEKDIRPKLKLNTWFNKEHLIRTKLLPYFGKLKVCKITAQQIVRWQSEMLNYKNEDGEAYSPVYLRSMNSQLSAIFNHAARYYNLKDNPCKKAGCMGKKKNREMLFWTKEEYMKFDEAIMDKPLSFYAFEMLYWCGIRELEICCCQRNRFGV